MLSLKKSWVPFNWPILFFHVAVFSCITGFLIGLLFTQRCGNYFVTMFDDYSATLPLIIVVVFETFSVAWLYGADRWGFFLLFRLWVMFLDTFRSWVPCKHQLLSHENKPLPVSFRFLDDIEVMLGWRPSVIYKYLWKYICLLAMLGLLGATTIRMFIKYPTYMAWNQEKVWRNRLYTV